MASHNCMNKCSAYKIPMSSDRRLGGNVGICSDCGIKMLWKKPRCPCCEQILRRTPRNVKMRSMEVFRH